MKRRQGFTVTELMIAIVIIGVLATLAIPGFQSYIYKARLSEATTFLGEIKQRQESYRDEFGRYAKVSSSLTDFHPSTIPGADPVAWSTTTEWSALGAAPDGPTRFSYCTIAGLAGVDSAPSGSNLDDDDHWFMARARGDLDEDGTTFDLEIYSQSNHIYNSATAKGGWE
ncbi:MAG: prepilin-type N-terminal cleavage/methylation domain-containing protein [Myxococcota bacterium]